MNRLAVDYLIETVIDECDECGARHGTYTVTCSRCDDIVAEGDHADLADDHADMLIRLLAVHYRNCETS